MIRAVIGGALGLDVRAIRPAREHKSPDLLVDCGGARILVEVERKTDDQQLRDLLSRESGATLQYSGGRTQERIESAWRQIRDYPHRQPSDSTLVWLIAGQRDATILTAKAAITRLYGLNTLEGYTEAGEYCSRPCYFFYESLFFKCKDLDAVIIQSYDVYSLCLNPYSVRFETWKTYPFLSAFSIIDPVAEESAGAAFLTDCSADRSDMHQVLQYLRQKYRLRALRVTEYVLVNMPAEP